MRSSEVHRRRLPRRGRGRSRAGSGRSAVHGATAGPGVHATSSTASATGSDASFDKWAFAAGTAAQSRPASEGGQGQATLDTVEGSFLVGASPFGAYWYPVKAFGDAVLPAPVHGPEHAGVATRNGGVMIRTPEIRYTAAPGHRPPSCAAEADRLQLRPLPGRAADLRPRHARGLDDLHAGPARAARSRRPRTPRTRRSRTRAPTARARARRT